MYTKKVFHFVASPVHIPTDKDEQTKEYIQMRDDHKLALKKVKQQISALCLRHDYRYDATASHWTQAHLKWLRILEPEGLYQDILTTYDRLTDTLERLERRIEELAADTDYQEKVHKLTCLLPILGFCPERIPAAILSPGLGSQKPETAM